MTRNQIYKFFKHYGYEIHARLNNEGVVSVYNKQFRIYKEDDCYWFDGFEVMGSEIVFHDKATPENLFSMIQLGWSLTKDIHDAIAQELKDEVQREVDREINDAIAQ